MTDKIYNLDENVAEYFEFSVFGQVYKFRQPNSEEMEKMKSISEDEKKSKEERSKEADEYLWSFITPKEEDAKPFSEVAKTMIAPQLRNFKKMIESEFGQ